MRARKKKRRVHEYVVRSSKAVEKGVIPRGEVTQSENAHDGWCSIYHGRFCDCDPTITVTILTGPSAGDVFRIDEDGSRVGEGKS